MSSSKNLNRLSNYSKRELGEMLNECREQCARLRFQIQHLEKQNTAMSAVLRKTEGRVVVSALGKKDFIYTAMLARVLADTHRMDVTIEGPRMLRIGAKIATQDEIDHAAWRLEHGA